MSSWISIAKPSQMGYVNVNPSGKEQYDQASLTYDSATTYYDGTNPNMWTDVAKPGAQSWISIAKPTN